MRTCSCGDLAEDGRDRCARCSALQSLGLDSSATANEIKDAYRTLVKVWHPDRFQGDPQLKKEAEEKLKAINAAHIFLTSKASQRPPRRSQPGSGFAAGASPKPRRTASSRFFTRLIPSPLALLKLAVLACGLLITALLLKAADSYLAAQPMTGRIYSEMRDGILSNFRQATKGLWSQTDQGLHSLIPEKAAAVSAAAAQSADDNQPRSALPANPSDHPVQNLRQREVGAAHPAAVRLTPYITAGLTQDEVIAIQGAPTSASADKLLYGSSELDFTAGKLTGWKIDLRSVPIRVKLWPDAPVDPGLESFGVGSSKSAVLVVQGTPTLLSEDRFGYGGSIVYFQNNRVVSWKNDLASVPLRVTP